MADKSKIFAETVKVYLAETGTPNTPASGWTEIGWAEGGKTQVAEDSRSNVRLDDDSDHKLGIKFKFDAVGLETDLVKIQALEAFEAEVIDILLVKREAPTSGYKLTKFSVAVAPNFIFSTTDPRRLNITGSRSAAKLSDVWDEVTGLSGFTIP